MAGKPFGMRDEWGIARLILHNTPADAGVRPMQKPTKLCMTFQLDLFKLIWMERQLVRLH